MIFIYIEQVEHISGDLFLDIARIKKINLYEFYNCYLFVWNNDDLIKNILWFNFYSDLRDFFVDSFPVGLLDGKNCTLGLRDDTGVCVLGMMKSSSELLVFVFWDLMTLIFFFWARTVIKWIRYCENKSIIISLKTCFRCNQFLFHVFLKNIAPYMYIYLVYLRHLKNSS